ncbi:MAG TPA: class I SAM-dependent methyltransferase [Candidatus Polarisedimenticolia bacterium]|jgi:magnesium-protoporphyrin O-methyltransferase|nr:class I SAM-dependent methyltransferase [Candidatus Polarisedimenticolia bacterium]
MTTCQCCAADQEFGTAIASRELRRFRKRGPNKPTRHLLDAVRRVTLPAQPSLLDVGGGIGAIHHVLLAGGFASATHMDASRAYLDVAQEEAERRGHKARVAFVHGDFHALAAATPPADVVTLDRVVCCDPDFATLLGAAADHARYLLALTYPHDRWYTRLFVKAINGLRRVRGTPFRAYIHPPEAISAVVERRGLRSLWSGGTVVWRVEVFER